MRRKAKLEKDLKVVLNDLEEKGIEVKMKDLQVQQVEDEFKRCDQHLRETRVSMEVLQAYCNVTSILWILLI